MNISVRKYKESDWDRLAEIHDPARIDELEGSVDLKAFIPFKIAAVDEDLIKTSTVLVAEDEAQVLGFVAFTEEEITWLYVDKNHYRKGVGKVLVKEALKQCGKKVYLDVLTGNTPAIKFYESLGFTIEKTIKGRLEGPKEFFAAEGHLMVLERK